MTLETQSRNIRIVAGITIFFGLLTALSAYPAFNAIYVIFADLVIWPADDFHRPLSAETRLTQAIMGGIFTGFGVMWWVASGALLRAAPEATRKMLFAGAVTWFVTDSAGSVLVGAAANVPPNIAFFLLFLWALRAPKEA
ncbi:hypothetical protein C8N43_0711 [Litoreibacter ponti]|uniref:Uncharacterized protein n=1 Tax=Litoreibacter ponti TaxID=1510457 RepID=A0A2T6BJ22_9RHOB|nr:hypothetical protein [Litoreibacter ponti]PTX56061.1 hypothetical protein C8N43_0711 [Litoreibacter ponti]